MTIKRPGCFDSKTELCRVPVPEDDRKKVKKFGRCCLIAEDCIWRVPADELPSDLGKMPQGRGKMLRSR